MRRGRILTGAAVLIAAAGLGYASSAALADDGGGTPQDICNDLKDGVVNGSYTAAQWTAFFSDPTIQGYGCGGGITPPPPPPTTTTTTTTVPTTTTTSTVPTTTTTSTTPVTTTTTTPTVTTPVPVTPTTPSVPLVPVTTVAGVAGATHTQSQKPVTGVKGASHTIAPAVTKSAAPLTATKASGTLPFTGAQLTIFTLVGLALIAAGIVLRLTTRRSSVRR